MNVQHVNVKFFVDGELNVDWERFIEVFHVWVAEQSTDELLIDVADYRHVPMGPGLKPNTELKQQIEEARAKHVALMRHAAPGALPRLGGAPGTSSRKLRADTPRGPPLRRIYVWNDNFSFLGTDQYMKYPRPY